MDKKLNFHEHIAGLCHKISRQISISNRFKCLIPLDATLQLYNSFMLSLLAVEWMRYAWKITWTCFLKCFSG